MLRIFPVVAALSMSRNLSATPLTASCTIGSAAVATSRMTLPIDMKIVVIGPTSLPAE
jgi:hypothetical protein